MSTRLSSTSVKSIPPAKPKYLALVRKFPLRLIQSEAENEVALAVLESLGERQHERPLAPRSTTTSRSWPS